MKIGDFKYHPTLGVVEITKIDYDIDSSPKLIEVNHLKGTQRILLQFAKIREATNAELLEYNERTGTELSEKQLNNWVRINEEIPNIKETFQSIVYEETKRFLHENPKLEVKLFGADTNIFYNEFLLSIDSIGAPETIKSKYSVDWNYFDFTNNFSADSTFDKMKNKLQSILFGENNYKYITHENIDEIQKEIQRIFIGSILLTKQKFIQMEKTKIRIVDHGENLEEADKLVA